MSGVERRTPDLKRRRDDAEEVVPLNRAVGETDEVRQSGFRFRVLSLMIALVVIFLLLLLGGAPVFFQFISENNANNAMVNHENSSYAGITRKEFSSRCAALDNKVSKAFNRSNVDLSDYPNLTIIDIQEIVGKPGGYGTRKGILNGTNDAEIPLDCNLYQPNDHRIIYFVHIHKSGGTTLCAAARANNALSNYEHNCLAKKSTVNADETSNASLHKQKNDPRCCGGDSLHQHYEYARRTHYTFLSNEWPMLDTMDVLDYRYVLVLRNSWSRYKSHYKYDKGKNLKSWLGTQPDNFNLRMICGQACLKRPKFHLTLQDLDYTVARLQLFDSIILLEDFNRTYTQFASKVGWKRWPGIRNVHHQEKQKRPTVSKEESETHASMTALDNALYEVAEALVESKNREGRVLAQDFPFSPETQLGLTKYLPLQEKYSRCKRPCCNRKCKFRPGWGDALNALLNDE